MALHFPSVPEVRLRKPPIEEVVCQVRFPSILRIPEQPPVAFQELIRHKFPELRVEQPVKFIVPAAASDQVAQAQPEPRVYRFVSPATNTLATLAASFFALSTDRYRGWSEFVDDLTALNDAVRQVYAPPYATRIGLRYVNRLNEASTGLSEADRLLALVHPKLTSLLLCDAWDKPDDALIQLSLGDGAASLTLRTIFGRDQAHPFLVLDFDYFQQGTLDMSDLVQICARYHDMIYRAFRWCMPDETLALFEPL